MPPELKPAYLIHGDDHGAVTERRARLRALAEAASGAGGVEVLEGDAATPESAARALSTMTFAMGRRVIIVDGAERWKDAEVTELLAPALADMPPDTTVAFFACEEGRYKASPALHQAVGKAGGQIAEEAKVKPWKLAGWVREQAPRHGIELDAAAAKALVAQVGERQQRLLRELEKLALDLGDGARVTVEDIEQRAAHSTEYRAFALADALVGGHAAEATVSYLRLRAQGERLSGLTYLMAQRLREAAAVAQRLESGESAAAIRRTLRMPPRAAERFMADVARSEPGRLRDALVTLADLELDTRGGAPVRGRRSQVAGLDEDTLAVAAIARIAG
jgi:DNA polymerase-3 subunit delta